MPLSNSPGFDMNVNEFLSPRHKASTPRAQSNKHKRLLRILIFGLACIAAVLGSVIVLTPSYGSVSGFIRDIDGNPMQAHVSIQGLTEPRATDSNGWFQISGIRSGTQTLSIEYASGRLLFPIAVPRNGSFTFEQIQIAWDE